MKPPKPIYVYILAPTTRVGKLFARENRLDHAIVIQHSRGGEVLRGVQEALILALPGYASHPDAREVLASAVVRGLSVIFTE